MASEKECGELEVLFQHAIANMKFSYPLWEELIGRAAKLHTSLRGTIVASSAFLESFQKLCDFATGTRGGTRDIGSSLTRLCFRQRTIETKLKNFTNSLMESIVIPLHEQIDDWKKAAVQLDKDHSREYKKAVQVVKKASSDTIRLQKKANKGKMEAQNQLQSALQDVNTKRATLETLQKTAVRSAFVEQRRQFCVFIKCLQPVMEHELEMLSEVTHLQDIVDNLCTLSSDPSALPESTEQAISDAIHGVVQPPSTLERKLHRRATRDMTDADRLSDKSAESSAGSVHLSAAASMDSVGAPADTTSAPAATVAPKLSDIPLPYDRPHTISSSVYQHPVRPAIAAETFEPPPAVAGNQLAAVGVVRHTAVPPQSTVAPSKVADIHNRSALAGNKDCRSAGPMAVATPTVPTVIGPNAAVDSTRQQQQPLYQSDHDSSAEMSSLADAIRDLEVNTAALQLPHSDVLADSCQSLQCSSGYGTMTNVSAGGSVETISTSAGEFEKLADALLESCNFSVLDKYCTLPSKRQPTSCKPPLTACRPASTAGDAVVVDYQSSDNIAPLSSSKVAQQTAATFTDDAVAFPPPPPTLSATHTTTLDTVSDSDDEFPLPPPPDDSLPAPSIAMTPGTQLMHSLSVKLVERSSKPAAPPVAVKHYRMSSVERAQSSVAAPPRQSTTVDTSLLSQIQRGVSLRRAVSNDRSAPRVPGRTS